MSMVGFPLLLIPLAIYNIIVFLMPGVSLAEPVFKLTLVSGAEWPLTLSDMLLALGIIMLLLEVIKGARPGAKFLTDHLLSLIIFGAAAAEFLLWPRFGNSTYFLLALLSLVDFLTGVTLRVRRSAQKVSAVTRGVREPAPVAPVPRAEPRLADTEPRAPVVRPAAESHPPEHSDGLSAHPEAIPSSEVAAPDLQPDHGVQRPPGPAPHQDPDLK